MFVYVSRIGGVADRSKGTTVSCQLGARERRVMSENVWQTSRRGDGPTYLGFPGSPFSSSERGPNFLFDFALDAELALQLSRRTYQTHPVILFVIAHCRV